jgi:hypothetical protein
VAGRGLLRDKSDCPTHTAGFISGRKEGGYQNVTGGTNTGLEAIAGIAVFLFTLLGMYLFVVAMGVASGGKTLPLARPVIEN